MPPTLAPMPGRTPIQSPSRLERSTRLQCWKASRTPVHTELFSTPTSRVTMAPPLT